MPNEQDPVQLHHQLLETIPVEVSGRSHLALARDTHREERVLCANHVAEGIMALERGGASGEQEEGEHGQGVRETRPRSRRRSGHGLHVRWDAGRFDPPMGIPEFSGLASLGVMAAEVDAQFIDGRAARA